MNFLEEMRWRGMVHDFIPGIEKLLDSSPVVGYIGFDPTSKSLHIGNLVQIMSLVHFQQAGHKPLALVGGATGMVGDPSGKSLERSLLSEEEVFHNQSGIQKQLEKFLDFEQGPTGAEMVNNFNWFKDYSFLNFIRDVGKHITVNYMIAKESVQKRMESGISFTEFSYQLVQGYDFYYLFQNKGCRLQMGGTDQWGNMVTGVEIIRRKKGGEAFAFTTPLVKKSDGTKFGKTEGGNIWLDPSKTSPYHFYQYWVNISDQDATSYIKIFTQKVQEEIEDLIKKHMEAPHHRTLQKELAKSITSRVHSTEACLQAIRSSEILFGKSDTFRELSEETVLDMLKGVPHIPLPRSQWEKKVSITDLLSVETKHRIFSSKGEARKMIQGGATWVNKRKYVDPNEVLEIDLLYDKFILIQRGKKNYFLIEIV